MTWIRSFCGMLLYVCVSNSYAQAHSTNSFEQDVQSYCNYIKAQTHAKTITLNSPDAIVRFNNGDVYNRLQQVVMAGLSKDLSDFRKAQLLKQFIKYECQYYFIQQLSLLQIDYTIPKIKKMALQYKLQLINQAKTHIQQKLRLISNHIHKEQDTLQNYYKIELILDKLFNLEQQIKINLANQKIPHFETTELKLLVQKLNSAILQKRRFYLKLQQLKNWSLLLQAGAQHNLTDEHNKTKPYLGVTLQYNLSSLSSNYLYSQANKNYINWQQQQVLGIQKKIERLKSSIIASQKTTQNRLVYLQEKSHQHQQLLLKLAPSNSSAGAQFKEQIESDQIIIDVEINYLKYLAKSLDILV